MKKGNKFLAAVKNYFASFGYATEGQKPHTELASAMNEFESELQSEEKAKPTMDILEKIHSKDADIVRKAKEISKALSMNKDTVKMFGDILAYIHGTENDEENIAWAKEMIDGLQDDLKAREDLYEDFTDSIKNANKGLY